MSNSSSSTSTHKETSENQQYIRELEQELEERKRAEKLQHALFKIASIGYDNNDLSAFAEFTLKLSNDFPFLYGAFAIILAIVLGVAVSVIRKIISDLRKKPQAKEEVKFPVK